MVENARGYRAPLFVDARIRRSVRAAGFRDGAFERLLGAERYRWMKGLGNKNLDSGAPALAEREQIDELLALTMTLHRSSRRAIFFCSCEFRFVDGPPYCHRCLITGELIGRAAAGRKTDRCGVARNASACSPGSVEAVREGR